MDNDQLEIYIDRVSERLLDDIDNRLVDLEQNNSGLEEKIESLKLEHDRVLYDITNRVSYLEYGIDRLEAKIESLESGSDTVVRYIRSH